MERQRVVESDLRFRTLALFDPLTQLPNRRLLQDRLNQTLAAAHLRGHKGAVLLVDLDNFKTINDTRGHAIGDRLLVAAGEHLLSCVRPRDWVARLGGDEFVVVLEDLGVDIERAATQAEEVGERVLAAMGNPLVLEGRDYHGSASVGICLFDGASADTEELLKRANSAMYRAKSSGRNTLRFYDPVMQAALEARVALENELRHALPKGQFVLFYQALFDGARNIVGAEVLLRWQHPDRGLTLPGEFITLAEESALIIPIGQWVLATACNLLNDWKGRPHFEHLTLSVNVSARQFRHPGFITAIQQVLEESGAEPNKLKLELTESLMLDNVGDTIDKMLELKALGVGVSMDDFGTGYSSLSYLKQLPLTELKIDRSFVRDIATVSEGAVIVRTIMGMARSLGLAVVAEGVETVAQFAFLKQHRCHRFQGYFLAHPVPLSAFGEMVIKACLSG